MSDLESGMAVKVATPVTDYSHSWFLPGEIAYVITPPHADGRSARVRCPASGADMWVPAELLEPAEGDRRVAALEARVDELERLIGQLGDGAWS